MTVLQIVPPDLAELIAANLPTALAAVGAYVIVFLAITFLARRDYDSSLGDYVVASRGLGWFVASLTLVATVLSGVGMAGFPGTVYSVGVPFITRIIIGYAVTAPATSVWAAEYGFSAKSTTSTLQATCWAITIRATPFVSTQ